MKNEIVHSFSDDVRKLLRDNLVGQYLFGSTVRGTANADSDIDILIIVKELNYDMRKMISSLASEYSLRYDISISPIMKEVEVWQKNRFYQTLFYKEVEREGILL